jgi:putative hemolysin
MDSQLVIELTAMVVLVLANGFFALSEFSIIASRPSHLEQKRQQNKLGAARAHLLRKSPEPFLASIQVGITLVGALLGVFSGATVVVKIESLLLNADLALLANHAKSFAVAIVVMLITVLSVVVGELVPKYIALSYPERYARLIAGPIHIFIKLTAPFSRLLSWSATQIVRMLGVRRRSGQQHVTEEEINQMILDGSREGVFETAEGEFVRSVFEFTDGTVSRAFTPRTDVIAIERHASPDRIVQILVENGYSRYPVYEGTIDNVVGIIYVKDIISQGPTNGPVELGKLIRKPVFVPDSMPLPKLLREFQRGKNHMAIVLDEFGGTAGLITLEDVLEELVGEIQDEYDTEAAPIVKHSETVAFADGDVWPGDINEVLNTHLPDRTFARATGIGPGRRRPHDSALHRR